MRSAKCARTWSQRQWQGTTSEGRGSGLDVMPKADTKRPLHIILSVRLPDCARWDDSDSSCWVGLLDKPDHLPGPLAHCDWPFDTAQPGGTELMQSKLQFPLHVVCISFLCKADETICAHRLCCSLLQVHRPDAAAVQPTSAEWVLVWRQEC